MSNIQAINGMFSGLNKKLTETCASGQVNDKLAGELVHRLSQLQSMFNTCMELNDKYLKLRTPEIQLDESTGIMYQIKNGNRTPLLQLNRADPDVPTQIAGQTTASSFVPGTLSDHKPQDEDKNKLKSKLSRELESFYYSASVLWDKFEQGLMSKPKSKFISVKMVRNRLIEHAGHQEINSFAASDPNGPQVKNQRRSDWDEKAKDPGLIPNTVELLEHMQRRLTG